MGNTKNLRINLISPSRWRYTRRLAEELCTLGSTVLLCVDKRKDGVQRMRSEKCFVKEVWRQNAVLPLYLFQLPLEVARIKPRIVHVQFEYLIFGRQLVSVTFPVLLFLLRLMARAESFKVVLTMHSVLPLDKTTLLEKSILLPYTKLITILSHRIIVHTNLAKEVLARTYGSLDEKKILVIPHGIETRFPLFGPHEIVGKGGVVQKRVFHFGIIRTSKGLNTLLEAFKKVLKSYQSVVLVIAGWFHEYLTEPGINELLSSIDQDEVLKGQVSMLTGYLPEGKLFEMASTSDVICLPYKENYVVGVSGATADIVMLGKPIIVTRCLKFLEFRNFPNVITAEGDACNLAKAIINALDQPPEAVVEPSILEKYAWDTVARKTLSCYQSVLGKEG